MESGNSQPSKHNNGDNSPKEIHFSKIQLKQLAHDQEKIEQTLRKLNKLAHQKCISNPQDALVFLNEAQKVLEYAASCGANIDKKIILQVLHNQAFCHQQLWGLQPCSNYLQAILYNISEYFNTNSPTPNPQDSPNPKFSINKNQIGLRGKPINSRIQLSEYYLQYCAVNSELGNHKVAKKSSKRAIIVLQDIIDELFSFLEYADNYSKMKDRYFPQTDNINRIISSLSKIPREFSIEERNNYWSTMKHYVQEWNLRKQQENNGFLREILEKFSIGHIMKLKFLQNCNNSLQQKSGFYMLFPENQRQHLPKQTVSNPLTSLNLTSLIHQIILLSIGYFTYATEIRLSIPQSLKTNKEKLRNLDQFRESQVYTLVSLIILFIYVPYDMLLIKHIFTSYKTNYLDLYPEEQNMNGKVLKDVFDSCSYGEFKKSEKEDQTKVYKSENKIILNDQMKTINFLSRQKSPLTVSRGPKDRFTSTQKKIESRFQDQYSSKTRIRSEYCKRKTVPFGTNSVNAGKHDIDRASISRKKHSFSKKRSMTSSKQIKMCETTPRLKYPNKDLKKSQKFNPEFQSEYYTKTAPQQKIKQKEIVVEQSTEKTKLKKIKSQTKLPLKTKNESKVHQAISPRNKKKKTNKKS